jgi:hypothetical protein
MLLIWNITAIKSGRRVVRSYISDWGDEFWSIKADIGFNFNPLLALASVIRIYLLPL